ncbi:hypothetical protein [Sporomusa sphaeroides]|uniref:Uncharacterized protein n=1 Tax=Sporomusa sphaeroides DSM 2875 TaxID=1337886 RepID=A0ABM9W461_9FIRM|nr:hypothetical protein [Sporomusa sphaeroides]OLS55512.1 hypothetical protein SPSPH_35600 [Sporomusa sphaeroides DSM 2875]CVK19951.1 hypothetical protein SSPH_02618 [Sporomusa sphaeroides DSM 2875]
MSNKKITALFTVMMLLITALAVPVSAQSADLTVIGKLAVVEKAVYGTPQTGAVADRITKIEEDVYGSETQEALLPRVDELYTDVLETSEATPSMLTKLNSVEWTLTHSVSDNSIKARIDNLETIMNGSAEAGSLQGRLDKLLQLAYTDGEVEVASTLIPQDTLIKIKTLSTLHSKQSRAGDRVALAVAEDVYVGNVLVLPKGSTGSGKVVKVSPRKNFGRDAKLEVSFDTLKTVDGKTIAIFVGEKAEKETKSLATAAGASVAGMIVLGPVGVIGGAFVSGKDVEIPIGSQTYVQTKEDVEIYGITVN